MANANDSAPWTTLRFEELLRILDVQTNESCERKKRFRQKLDSLKERQEELQQRRVSRLRNEGIHIDLALVKKRVKEPKWMKVEEENTVRKKALNDKLRELFRSRDTKVKDDDTSNYLDSENKFQQIENKELENKKSRVKVPSREPTNTGDEEDTQDTHANVMPSTDQVKTVEVRVKKHGTKRSVRAVGQVVSTTKYLRKISNKNNKTISRTMIEAHKRKQSFTEKK